MNATAYEGATKLQARARRVVRPIANALWKFELVGFDRLPTSGPAILCANHISFLDSAFLMIQVPRNISFVGKSEYMDSWKTRYLFPALGMIPIDRSGGEKSQEALQAAESVLRRVSRQDRSGPTRPLGGLSDLSRRHHWDCRDSATGCVSAQAWRPRANRDRARNHAGSLLVATRRPHGVARDDRRSDVRDSCHHRPGVPQRLCVQGQSVTRRIGKSREFGLGANLELRQ